MRVSPSHSMPSAVAKASPQTWSLATGHPVTPLGRVCVDSGSGARAESKGARPQWESCVGRCPSTDCNLPPGSGVVPGAKGTCTNAEKLPLLRAGRRGLQADLKRGSHTRPFVTTKGEVTTGNWILWLNWRFQLHRKRWSYSGRAKGYLTKPAPGGSGSPPWSFGCWGPSLYAAPRPHRLPPLSRSPFSGGPGELCRRVPFLRPPTILGTSGIHKGLTSGFLFRHQPSCPLKRSPTAVLTPPAVLSLVAPRRPTRAAAPSRSLLIRHLNPGRVLCAGPGFSQPTSCPALTPSWLRATAAIARRRQATFGRSAAAQACAPSPLSEAGCRGLHAYVLGADRNDRKVALRPGAKSWSPAAASAAVTPPPGPVQPRRCSRQPVLASPSSSRDRDGAFGRRTQASCHNRGAETGSTQAAWRPPGHPVGHEAAQPVPRALPITDWL